MHKLLNQMRLQANLALNNLAKPRLGTITSYDPVNYCVKVALQPLENDSGQPSETGWLPLMTPWVGNGWGMFCAPKIGDMIEVQFQEGCWEVGLACLRAFNDVERPLNVPAGEFWLVHASGAFIKLTNDGDIAINSGTGDINIASTTGNINVNGNPGAINVSSESAINISAPAINIGNGGSLQGVVTSAFADLFNNHVHPAGSPNTGVPTTSITSDQLTTVLQAE